MDWFAKAFIKSSLSWLAAGATLGIAIAMHPVWVIYRPAHLHMNLLGFVTMMIAGVGYHVFPRFVGQPLHSARLAATHLVLANVGLALMVAGFMTRPGSAHNVAAWLLGGGATMSALAIYLFVYNTWRTLDARPRMAPRPRPASGAQRRQLPLAEELKGDRRPTVPE